MMGIISTPLIILLMETEASTTIGSGLLADEANPNTGVSEAITLVQAMKKVQGSKEGTLTVTNVTQKNNLPPQVV